MLKDCFMSHSLRVVSRSLLPLMLVLALLGLGACSKSVAPKAATAAPGGAAKMPAPTVGVMGVQLGAVALALELPGRLEAARSADVRARAGGVVLQRLFTEGRDRKSVV